MSNNLVFATENPHKFSEASAIASEYGVDLIQFATHSVEIQTDIISDLVARKAREAFLACGQALFVEHTSLHIPFVGGFPAGYTSRFMAYFGEDKVCELFGIPGRNAAVGKTTLGYCNGRNVSQFEGTISGTIPSSPDGEPSGWEAFGWNRIFVPDGHSVTLSRLGQDAKNKMSMRRDAMAKLIDHLQGSTTCR